MISHATAFYSNCFFFIFIKVLSKRNSKLFPISGKTPSFEYLKCANNIFIGWKSAHLFLTFLYVLRSICVCYFIIPLCLFDYYEFATVLEYFVPIAHSLRFSMKIRGLFSVAECSLWIWLLFCFFLMEYCVVYDARFVHDDSSCRFSNFGGKKMRWFS